MPIRWIFRSRWAAILWAGGICWSAASLVVGDGGNVDAANAADTKAAVSAALGAEDPD